MTPDLRGNDSPIATDGDTTSTDRGPTRRQALALAGGTAAAVGVAAGPFAHLFSAGAAEGEPTPEVALTSWLVGIELAARDLYETVRDSTAFDDATRELAATCGGHHDDQAGALATMVAASGGTAPTEANTAFTAEFAPRLEEAADGAAKATVLAEIENGFAATYQASFTVLTSAPIAAFAAQILATDAAHAVVWSAAANGQGATDPMPTPDAVPESQTSEGQFEQTAFTPAPATTTTTGDES